MGIYIYLYIYFSHRLYSYNFYIESRLDETASLSVGSWVPAQSTHWYQRQYIDNNNNHNHNHNNNNNNSVHVYSACPPAQSACYKNCTALQSMLKTWTSKCFVTISYTILDSRVDGSKGRWIHIFRLSWIHRPLDPSPWYDLRGWPGVKSQSIYLPMDPSTLGSMELFPSCD